MKYTFQSEDRDTRVTVESDAVSLDRDDGGLGLLFDIKCFLLACGFQIDGELEIVREDYGQENTDRD